MKIVFAGKFECALVRGIDGIIQPRRNETTHEYYVGLNRQVSKQYSDRCGTFIAIANEVLVPQIDWNYPIDKKYRGSLTGLDLGIESTESGGREWDQNTQKLVKHLIGNRALSSHSYSYISKLSLSNYPQEPREEITQNLTRYEGAVANHYLNRLFLQLRAAREAAGFTILSEDDIQVLEDIGKYCLSTKLPIPFDIPDLQGRLINPDAFCDGILNFSPPDIFSVATVRSDSQIRAYGAKLGSLLAQNSSGDRERQILKAMVEAHKKSSAGERAEKIFEIGSWVVKPLHYVPISGEILSVAEDLKDVAQKWADREISRQQWYLIGVRMADIAIKDYLARKANIIEAD